MRAEIDYSWQAFERHPKRISQPMLDMSTYVEMQGHTKDKGQRSLRAILSWFEGHFKVI